MVAIVSGNNLGLNLSSLAISGGSGQIGNAAMGRSGDRSYVDVSTGNLVIQGVDNSLTGLGQSIVDLRTYNSQGTVGYNNNDGWLLGGYKKLVEIPSSDPTLPSTFQRTDADGSVSEFVWNSSQNTWVQTSTTGTAKNFLTNTSIEGVFAQAVVWVNGSTGTREIYDPTTGLISSSVDSTGFGIGYSYDAAGRLISAITSEGESTNYRYVGSNLTSISVNLQDGRTINRVSYGYDASNRLTSVSVDLAQESDATATHVNYTTNYAYDGGSNRVSSVQQSDGTNISISYILIDGEYKVSTYSDGNGGISNFNYDNINRTTLVTDAYGVSTRFQYDTNGRLTQINQGVTQNSPTGASQLQYTYNSYGEIVAALDGAGRMISNQYDINGNLTAQIDGEGDAHVRVYSDLGGVNRLVSETIFANTPQPSGKAIYSADIPLSTRYIYSTANPALLRFVIKPDGSVVEYVYDNLSQQVSTIGYLGSKFSSDNSVNPYIPSETELSAWVATTDLTKTQRTDYAHDYRGQISSITTYGAVDAAGSGDASTASRTQYIYDPRGLLLQSISPDGSGITQNIYDGLGRQIASSGRSLDGSISSTVLTSFDDAHGKVTTTLANGLTSTATYDKAGQLISVIQNSADGTILSQEKYAYDADGRQIQSTDATGLRSWIFYDAAGRKVADVNGQGQLAEYLYDGSGKLTESIKYSTPIDTSVLDDASGNPRFGFNVNPAAATAGSNGITLDAIRPATSPSDSRAWTVYDHAGRLAWQIDSLGYVTQTKYDNESRVASVTRLANPVDVTLLGSGGNVNLSLLGLGGSVSTTVSLSIDNNANGASSAIRRTLVAQVSSPGNTYSGTVSFFSGNTLLGIENINPYNNGKVWFNAYLPAGQSMLTAVYSGDANFASSVSGIVSSSVATPAYSSTISLQSDSQGRCSVDGSSWIYASISTNPPLQGVIFPSVDFYIDGNYFASSVGNVFNPGVQVIPPMTVGNHQITAKFNGGASGNFYVGDYSYYDVGSSTSAPLTFEVTPANSQTTLAISKVSTPSYTPQVPGSPAISASYLLSANISGFNDPNGLVEFYNGQQLLGTATTINGVAYLPVYDVLPQGECQLSANYLGDSNNYSSLSAVQLFNNTPPPAKLGVFYCGYSSGAQTADGSVTLTAYLQGDNPTGTVELNIGSGSQSAAIVNGKATFNLQSPLTSPWGFSLSYAGDANNGSGYFDLSAVDPTVYTTSTTLNASTVASSGQDSLTLTAHVNYVDANGNTQPVHPTSTYQQAPSAVEYVAFYDGATLLGYATVSDGVASLSQIPVTGAPRSLRAEYLGAANSYGPVSILNASSSTVVQLPAATAGVVQTAPTSVNLSSSAASSAIGGAVTLTAQVVPTNGNTVTGVVTFLDGTTVLGTGVISAGVATLTLNNLSVGAHALKATYGGDTNSATSVGALTQTITTASSTTALGASASAITSGAAVWLTATVAGSAVAGPTGTVNFYNGATLLGSATITNGVAALSVTSLPVGSNTAITAQYAGDTNNAASTSAAAAVTVSAAKAASTTALSASVATAGAGAPVTLTATLTGTSPTGTVSFFNGATLLGSAVVGAVTAGKAVLTLGNLPVGADAIKAIYSGDAANATSTSAVVTETITAAVTTTALTLSSGSTAHGAPLTLSAAVSNTAGAGLPVPSGTVTFYNGATSLGTASLVNGVASLNTSTLPLGPDSLTAVYAGDSNNATSTSGVQTETVQTAPTSVNLSSSAASSAIGGAVTLTAQVVPTNGNTVTGVVTFLDGTTVLGTGVISAGVATLTLNNLSVGAHALKATYGGDTNSATSVGALTQTITTASSTTALGASASAITSGAAVWLTATVAGSAVAGPTGTVNFYNGATLLGSATITNGVAALSVTSLPVGSNTAITAQYAGDTNNAASTSAAAAVTVSAAKAASTTALSASVATAGAGAPVTLTATLTGTSPTGTVSFFNGATLLGSAVVGAVTAGKAVLTLGNLPVGADAIKAIYSGDAANATSTSAVVTETITAAAGATTTSLSLSVPSSVRGDSVTLTASVAGQSPTGTIAFYSEGVLLGNATLANGTAQLVTTDLQAGRDFLWAEYSGDAANIASSSAVVDQTVNRFATAMSYQPIDPTQSPLPSQANGWAVITNDKIAHDGFITVNVGASQNPTGVVVFLCGGVVVGRSAVVNGQAELYCANLPLGEVTVTANYSGDSNNQSSSIAVDVTVCWATAIESMTVTGTSNPDFPLQIHLQMGGADRAVPIYAVENFGEWLSAPQLVGTVNLRNGVGSISVPNLGPNKQSSWFFVTDSVNLWSSLTGVSSGSVQIPFPVGSVSCESSSPAAKQGEPLTLVAKVSFGTDPQPQVTFLAGKTVLGNATAVNGVATLQVDTTSLPPGSYDIVATYPENGNNANNISSASITQVIAANPQLVDLTASANDRTQSNIYDFAGRLTGVVDAEGFLTQYKYNEANQLVETIAYSLPVSSLSDPSSFATALETARELGDVTFMASPVSSGADVHTHYMYNARGQLVGKLDGTGYLTETVYDVNGRVAKTIQYANPANLNSQAPLAAAALSITPSSMVAPQLMSMIVRVPPAYDLANLRPVSSSEDRITVNTWDALGRLISQTNPEGSVSQFAYDSVGNLIQTTVATGTSDQRLAATRYDLQGRVTAELSADGASLLTSGMSTAQVDAIWAQYATHYGYDAAGRRLSATDANGHRSVYYYDDAGRLRFSIDAAGKVSETQYDALGHVSQTASYATAIAQANLPGLQGGLLSAAINQPAVMLLNSAQAASAQNSVTQLNYDADGRILNLTNALGGTTHYTYDAFDAVSVTQALQAGQRVTSTAVHDRRGLVVSSLADVGVTNAATATAYDAFGRVVRSTDANGNVTLAQYDANGRIVSTTDPANATRSSTYDAFGRVLTRTDALGQVTSYAYDKSVRSVTLTTPEGVQLATAHNREGQTQQITDGNGNTTSFQYDANGNLLSSTSPAGTTTRSYDASGLLVSSTDANGVVTTYSYDPANRLLVRTVDPTGLNLVTRYGYDAKGQQLSTTDPRGIVTLTSYDTLGEVLSQTVDPTGQNLVTRWSYDQAGHVLSVTSPGGSLAQYVYDDLGRRVQTIVDPAGLNLVTHYTYDAVGNMVASTDPKGGVSRVVYDANNRVTYTVDAMGGVVEYRYDSNGRQTVQTRHSQPIDLTGLGTPLTESVLRLRLNTAGGGVANTRTYYDHDGRVIKTIDPQGTVTNYGYDGNGNVIDRVVCANTLTQDQINFYNQTQPAADPIRDIHVRSVFDAANRLTWTVDATGAVTQYQYDTNGNLIDRTAYATVVPTTTAATAAALSAAVGGIANASNDQHTRSVYDSNTRLIWTISATGAVTHYQYDADGNPVDSVAYAHTVPSNTPASQSALAAAVANVVDAAHDLHSRAVYDLANRLTWTIDGAGAVAHYQYDANGNVIDRVAYANTVPVGTDATAGALANAVTGVADASRDVHVRSVYDANNRLSWRIDGTGAVAHYQYDANGNVIDSVSYATPAPANTVATAQALANATLAIADASRDVHVRSVYDADNRLSWTLDAQGAVVHFRYDARGNLIDRLAYANPVAAGTVATETALASAVALIADPTRDQHIRSAYDGNNRVIWTLDAAGGVTHYVYNAAGDVVERTAYATAFSATLIVFAGRVMTDADFQSVASSALYLVNATKDQHVRSVYDASNHLTWTIDGTGAVTHYQYDANGNNVARTTFAKSVNPGTAATDQVLGQATAAIADVAHDATTLSTFDAANHLLYSVDGTRAVTAYQYDGLGNVTRKTSYANALPLQLAPQNITPSLADRQVEYVYDAANRVAFELIRSTAPSSLGATDGLSNLRQFVHDANGQLVQVVDGAGTVADTVSRSVASLTAAIAASAGTNRTTETVYNAAGQAIFQVDALGAVTQTTYDAVGHATASTQYAKTVDLGSLLASGAPALALSPSHLAGLVQPDAKHDRTRLAAFDATGRQVYSVDPLGYVTQTQYDALGQVSFSTQYANALPALAQGATAANIRDALVGHTDPAKDQTTAYLYDAQGNLKSTTDALSNAEQYSYDALGRKTGLVNKKNVAFSYEYDASGHLTGITEPSSAQAGGTVTTRMGYDSLGNLTSRTEAFGTTLARTTSYVYDALGRQVQTIYPPVAVYDPTLDALNNDNPVSPRPETLVTPTTQVIYNTLGDAVANIDAAGNVSLKAYDLQGRLVDDVDALGFVTSYQRNSFGDIQTLTHYAGQTTLPAGITASSTVVPDAATVQAAVVVNAAQDRSIVTHYDKLGRAVDVTQPAVWVTGASGAGSFASAVTRNQYDAFGSLVQTSALADAQSNTWAITNNYYDQRGQLIATIDPMGYLSTQSYDAEGNQQSLTQFAIATSGATPAGYVAPSASADDRTVTFGYDRANRKTSQTFVAVAYSAASDGTTTTGNLTTTYGYDALGNNTRTTDALGNSTYTYYDAAGRITAVASPTRNSTASGASITPLTKFVRDVYGNVTQKVEFGGNGALSANEASYVLAASTTGTRVTSTSYDSHGLATQSVDASGATHYMSYDILGRLVKSWQAVTGNDHVAHVQYTLIRYDALGRQIRVLTPASTSLLSAGSIVSESQKQAGTTVIGMAWNAFGEMVQRGTWDSAAGAAQYTESFDYDAAGRLWRSNAGDGVQKVTLYDVQGHQSAQISSAGGIDLSSLATAQAVDQQGNSGLRRTDKQLDLLGRVLSQTLPQRQDASGTSSSRPVVNMSYDRWGNALTQSDVRSAALVTQYRYNWNNQVIQQTQPDDATGAISAGSPVTQIYYDAAGHQVAVRDANGHLNTQTWDAADHLVQEGHADGGVVTHSYDIFGEQAQVVDAMGYTTTYGYDAMGRQTSTTHLGVGIYHASASFVVSGSTGLNLTLSNTYDQAGHKLTQTDGDGHTTLYSYDLAGNVVAVTDPNGATTRAAFDRNGHQSAGQDGNGRISTWAYDAFGQLTAHQDIGGYVYSFSYDNARQLLSETNQQPGQALAKNISYSYDAAGQLVQINDLALNQLTQYSDNAAGQHVHERTTQAGVVYQDQALGYDNLGRLALVQDSANQVSLINAYDKVGNKLSQTNIYPNPYLPGLPESTQTLNFAYDSMNRQTLVDGAVDGNAANLANITSTQGHILAYDKSGNRILDEHWGTSVVAQYTEQYDAAGNPTGLLASGYTPQSGVIADHYAYDAMNRLSSVSTDAQASQVMARQQIGVDESGNPVYATHTVWRGGDLVDAYTLAPTTRVLSGDQATVLDQRKYDGASRLVQSGPAGSLSAGYLTALVGANLDLSGAATTTSTYDAAGRIMAQHVVNEASPGHNTDTVYANVVTTTTSTSTPVILGYDESGNPVYSYDESGNQVFTTTTTTSTTTTGGYDNAGNVLGYVVTQQTDAGTIVSNYNTTLAYFDGYRAGGTTALSTNQSSGNQTSGTTGITYDVNGLMVGVTDSATPANNRTLVNDAQGHVLAKTQGANVARQLVAGGNVLGLYGLQPDGTGNVPAVHLFDLGYQPVTNSYPAASTGQYPVHAGDTLRSIAQAAYGDAELWYQIADANGLSGDADLRVGQVLSIPTRVGGAHNNAGTVTPYDPSRITGATGPQLPTPAGNQSDSCGGFGSLIVTIVAVVVAVVVTAYTENAQAGQLSFDEIMAAAAEAGPSASASSLAAGAVAGDIAGQITGNIVGTQQGYNWKQTALAGITAYVGGSIAQSGTFSGMGQTANTFASQALANAATQVVAVQIHAQDHFSWRRAAAAGATAALSSYGGSSGPLGEFAGRMAGGYLAAKIEGRGANLRSIATDAFGNVIGNALGFAALQALGAPADNQPPAVDYSQAPDQSSAETARLNSNEAVAQSGVTQIDANTVVDNRPAAPSASADAFMSQLTDMMSNPAQANSSPGVLLADASAATPGTFNEKSMGRFAREPGVYTDTLYGPSYRERVNADGSVDKYFVSDTQQVVVTGQRPSYASLDANSLPVLGASASPLLSVPGPAPVELPQVVITGLRMSDAQKAAYDAAQAGTMADASGANALDSLVNGNAMRDPASPFLRDLGNAYLGTLSHVAQTAVTGVQSLGADMWDRSLANVASLMGVRGNEAGPARSTWFRRVDSLGWTGAAVVTGLQASVLGPIESLGAGATAGVDTAQGLVSGNGALAGRGAAQVSLMAAGAAAGPLLSRAGSWLAGDLTGMAEAQVVGRLGNAGNLEGGVSSAATTLARIEGRFAGAPREVGFIVDSESGAILTTARQPYAQAGASFRFTDQQWATAEGNWITHNHPSGLTLGLEDLAGAVSSGARGIRASTASGVYQLAFDRSFASAYRGSPGGAFGFLGAETNSIGTGIMADVRSGSLALPAGLTGTARGGFLANEMWTRYANQTPGLQYTFTPW